MSLIDTSMWKWFKVSDFFTCKRGKRIVKNVDYFEMRTQEYCFPVITATTMNNSIDGYYNQKNCDGNVVCCGGEATGMFATLQTEPCWVMDRSRILQPKISMSQNVMLFFATLFKLEMYRYHYQRSANPDMILSTDIKLPVKNDTPDWEYMENFVNKIYSERTKRIITNNDAPISLTCHSNWKWFSVSDIFPYSRIKKFSKSPDEQGDIEFVSSSSLNNGISQMCNETPVGEKCITVSTNGECFDAFYHEEPIVVSSDVEILSNEKLNKWNALFICTILKLEKFRWTYGRKPKNMKVFNTKIKLPEKNGVPDWEYMENYIKSLPYGDKI